MLISWLNAGGVKWDKFMKKLDSEKFIIEQLL